MSKLYFLRHGQSQANLDGVYAADASPLTNRGREQARAAGKQVAALGITPVIASPLPRALETAQIVCRAAGLDGSKIIQEPRLRELGVGNLAGTTNNNLPGYLKHQADPQGDTSVETLEAAKQRLKSFIDSLGQYPDGVILLVGHNGSGLLLRGLLSGDTSDIAARPSLPNAEPFELTVKQEAL